MQIAAPPRCEADARRCFGELLGLREIEKPDSPRQRGGAWFAIGAQQLHVGIEYPFQPARNAHLALRVAPKHLDDLAARLSDAGIEVSWDDALSGTRRFYAKDPWGSRLEFLTGG